LLNFFKGFPHFRSLVGVAHCAGRPCLQLTRLNVIGFLHVPIPFHKDSTGRYDDKQAMVE
jgi:hypothetical protein